MKRKAGVCYDAADCDRARRMGSVAETDGIRAALEVFNGFADKAMREALYGLSSMAQREYARRLEVLVEFSEASRRAA